MPQFKVIVTSTGTTITGSDKLLVLSESDNLEHVSYQIHEWAKETYHGNVITSTEKLNNSNEVFVSDLTHEKYHKVIFL
jgi:hypothetical protein